MLPAVEFSSRVSIASARSDEGLAQTGKQSGQRNGPAMLGPGSAIHAHIELALRENGAPEQDFEVFISTIILDRNSQVCFHKVMVTGRVMKANRALGRAPSLA